MSTSCPSRPDVAVLGADHDQDELLRVRRVRPPPRRRRLDVDEPARGHLVRLVLGLEPPGAAVDEVQLVLLVVVVEEALPARRQHQRVHAERGHTERLAHLPEAVALAELVERGDLVSHQCSASSLASIAGVPVVSPETYLAGLNEAQRDAVLLTEGPVLVVAGAGSGKTRVLTHRVAHLIGAIGAQSNEILAITFTNRAADEMRTRLWDILSDDARGLWVLTFHATCGRILRRDAPLLGYRSNFTIYDQADQVRLVKNVLEELERDTKRFVPRGIHAQISNAKNQLVSPTTTASASRRSTTRPSPTSTGSIRSACTRRTRWTSTTCSCSPSRCSSASRRRA
jgi:DNA helicase-2/ATP-dependent DNA helicase PcrA